MSQNKESQEISQQQMIQFMRKVQLKNLQLKGIMEIYKKYCLTQHFENTARSAILLIFLPAFTNIYYTFRPNKLFAGFMPFLMPIICFGQYLYVFQAQLSKFCFSEQKDAQKLREKYKILYQYTQITGTATLLMDNIREFEQKQNKKDSIIQQQSS